jgi:hypothetical protein
MICKPGTVAVTAGNTMGMVKTGSNLPKCANFITPVDASTSTPEAC